MTHRIDTNKYGIMQKKLCTQLKKSGRTYVKSKSN